MRTGAPELDGQAARRLLNGQPLEGGVADVGLRHPPQQHG